MNRRAAIAASCLCLLAWLPGCGRESSTPSPHQSNAARSPEVVRVGAVAMNISAIQTRQLPAQIAQRYGVAHDARTVLIVVSLREGDEARSTSRSARAVQATVSDLLGRKQNVSLREMRDGDLVDYIGVATVTPPDTLRFEIVAFDQQGQRYRALFNRDFF